MRNVVLMLTFSIAFSGCLLAKADEDSSTQETIAVPASYPDNWLEKRESLPTELAPAKILQKKDGTIVIANASPTFSFTGSALKPKDVVAFVDLGSRSIMLKAKKDSVAYKMLKNNVTLKHGDARQPRFIFTGTLCYCAPVLKNHVDWLNPVPVLEVEEVRFYLVAPAAQ